MGFGTSEHSIIARSGRAAAPAGSSSQESGPSDPNSALPVSGRLSIRWLIAFAAVLPHFAQYGHAQGWSHDEDALNSQIVRLQERKGAHAAETRRLALDIRKLPPSAQKVLLAANLVDANADDFRTRQEETTTLAGALRGGPYGEHLIPYKVLAELIRYEHTSAVLNDPRMSAAMAELDARDHARQQTDFTLPDLSGRPWTLKALAGKVVVVNFWSPGCGPCIAEMPALSTIHRRFSKQGVVILAISMDTETSVTRSFLARHPLLFPVLPDPDRKVGDLFQVVGIPVSLVYDRDGKLISQAFSSWSEKRFLTALSEAGLKIN